MGRRSKNSLLPPSDRAGFRAAPARFLGLFLGIVIVYYLLTATAWVDARVIYPVLQATAHGASLILNAVGAHTRVEGVVIQGPAFAVRVQRGCDPLEPIVLFWAAVIAFPAPVPKKATGLALGSITLFGLNLIRIITLYWVGKARWSCFEAIHQELWPALFILLAVLLWVFWLTWTRRVHTTSDA